MGSDRRRMVPACVLTLLFNATPVRSQEPPAPHDHSQMQMQDANPWHLMQDGIVVVEFNRQGGPRGGAEVVAPNWWMGMASRNAWRGRLTLTAMASLDPATVGASGYREIFQVGEAFEGKPLVDRQHPHDAFMQLAASWRVPLGEAGVTIAGGPVGEPALGPVAFMHRASAADNPTAPLGHHTLDSSHVAFGVVTVAVDRGPVTIETSLFNGREPDEHRWDFDFARLDSFSGRVWYRPNSAWEFQASSGRLKDPEELEVGDLIRSTASASWMRRDGAAMSAVTVAYGRNDRDRGRGSQSAFLAEGTRYTGSNTLYARFEALQVEINPDEPVFVATLGGVHDVLRARGFEGGIGADVSVYRVPDALAPLYSSHPVSFHLFFRLRPPAGVMGRMWNMRMGRGM